MTQDRCFIKEGSVHGRFQPLHNDHLEYILAGKRFCKFLWIGITKYETAPQNLNPLGRQRERPESNPLTYHERLMIIREALTDEGVPRNSYDFVPFPIETPSSLLNFLPSSVTCFTTVCEDWNREKIRVLKECGYPVHVLWERIPKRISGSEIRASIARGDEDWRGKVPPATARAVGTLHLQTRLSVLFRPIPDG
jgi:nicotinamide mononucleotide adenylyltransferase